MSYERSIILSKDISAFSIERVEGGELLSRHIERIPSGTEVTVVYEGFDRRTVTVQCNDRLYFAFLQDIEEPDSSYYFD